MILPSAIFARHGLSRPRRRRRRMPKQRQPNAERLAYAGALMALLARARELVQQELVPKLAELVRQAGVVHDAVRSYPDTVIETLDTIAEKFFAEFSLERLRRTALGIAQRVNGVQKAELNRQLAAAAGQEIGINVFGEPGIQQRLEAFAAANAQLVKRVPQQFFDEVGARVVDGLRRGERAEDLQQVIQDRFGVSESRARLIARDQVGRLYSELNRTRQQDLGIRSFTWAASRDERECDECAPYDGKTYSWDAPPAGGYPGEVHPNCRCTAEPNVQEILDNL